MSGIAAFIASICAACIFIGALQMLCTQGAVSKSASFLLSLVFLVSVISAAGLTVKRADFNFNLPTVASPDTSDLDIAAARYVYAVTLEQAGLDFREIKLYMDKSDDGSISISKISIWSDCSADKILTALSEVAKNIEVEIINE